MPKGKNETGSGSSRTGNKLKRLREKKKLSLEKLSEMTGIKVSHIEEIEGGESFASVGDLLSIARALTVKPEVLMKDKGADKDQRKKRIDAFKKREEAYNYRVLTPNAGNKHLRAFNVTIPPESEHPKVNFQHEGEEFVYVLKGEVVIRVGQKSHELTTGDSLHFNSGVKHSLRNPGKKETVLIVTVYTP